MKAKNDGDLYLLMDGTYMDPADCSVGKDGVMRHSNGVKVAMTDAGEPMTLARVTEHNVAANAAAAAAAPAEPVAADEKPKAE